jgi:hypothetical protein
MDARTAILAAPQEKAMAYYFSHIAEWLERAHYELSITKKRNGHEIRNYSRFGDSKQFVICCWGA